MARRLLASDESLLSQLNATTGDTSRLQIGIVLNAIVPRLEDTEQTSNALTQSRIGSNTISGGQRSIVGTTRAAISEIGHSTLSHAISPL